MAHTIRTGKGSQPLWASNLITITMSLTLKTLLSANCGFAIAKRDKNIILTESEVLQDRVCDRILEVYKDDDKYLKSTVARQAIQETIDYLQLALEVTENNQ